MSYLKEAGMEVELFEGIEPDPSVETVMTRRGGDGEVPASDWIVAIGGGSPIDAAKAMWIKYEYPEITFEDMCKVFRLPEAAQKSAFLRHSVHLRYRYRSDGVLHYHRLSRRASNIPMADFEITPDVAIVDPGSGGNHAQEADRPHRYGRYDPRH